MILTYRYRVKDGRASDRAALRKQASAVNFVWNYCCEIQREAERRRMAGMVCCWPTYFDLTYLAAGSSRELGVLATTINGVCRAFVVARDRARHRPNWRSARKSLDWIPISNAATSMRLDGGAVVLRKRRYRLWLSRDLPADAEIKTAAFACDARGRWYVNATVETAEVRAHGDGEVGIDLGLKSLATLSTGEVVPNLRYGVRYADALATAQRARSKRRVRAIHAKIANSRKDHLHKIATAIMRTNRRVVVGNVSPSRLAKTKMARSVMDAGWTTFRSYLSYKALRHQVEYSEVREFNSSRTCSVCGVISAGSPKGMSGLGVRAWRCEACGTAHDRDVNAARNILLGAERRPPAVEIAA